MKKIIFSLLAIIFIFFINENVSALSLSMPTGYAHESFRPVGENVKLPIVESSNSFGYANYAMDFIRNKSLHDPETNTTYYNAFYNWYGFVFDNLNHDCGNSSVLLKGVFVTWTNYNPGVFSNSPYIIFTNSNNENTNCSVVSSNNSNVLEFSCLVENMTSSGSFNIGFNDPGPTFNGAIYLENYNTYVGISKNLDLSCQISTSEIVNIQNQNKNEIINNQNNNANQIIGNAAKNTTDIINNQTQNSQEIINNQNKNNEELKDTINDNFNNCRESKNLLNLSNTISSHGITSILNENGSLKFNGILDGSYFSIISQSTTEINPGIYTFSTNKSFKLINLRLYFNDGTQKDFEIPLNQLSTTFTIDKKAIAYHVWIKGMNNGTNYNENLFLQLQEGSSATKFEKYGEEICSNKIDETNNQLGDLNNNLTDSNIDSSSANNFFNNFKDENYGLSSIITSPLKFIQNLNNNQCTDLSVPIPYIKNQNLKLPCMDKIYKQHFNALFTLYQNITTGFIAYWVAVRIFALVKGFKDPEDDKIEVMDL